MSGGHEICPAAELQPGERKIVEVSGVSIGVFNVDGEYHALLNACQHQYGPVCEGKVIPSIESAAAGPGEYPSERVSDDKYELVCPWHGWTYDVETGEHTGDADISLPTYSVEVRDGTVYLEP